jgi:hypothetical protein
MSDNGILNQNSSSCIYRNLGMDAVRGYLEMKDNSTKRKTSNGSSNFIPHGKKHHHVIKGNANNLRLTNSSSNEVRHLLESKADPTAIANYINNGCYTQLTNSDSTLANLKGHATLADNGATSVGLIQLDGAPYELGTGALLNLASVTSDLQTADPDDVVLAIGDGSVQAQVMTTTAGNGNQRFRIATTGPETGVLPSYSF